VSQAIQILHGDRRAKDYVEVLLTLGGWMVHLAGKARSPEEGMKIVDDKLSSGAGLDKFKHMVKRQGGDPKAVDDVPLGKEVLRLLWDVGDKSLVFSKVMRSYLASSRRNPRGQTGMFAEEQMTPLEALNSAMSSVSKAEDAVDVEEIVEWLDLAKALVEDGELLEKSRALYIGPRGGRWADPKHTIPYVDEPHPDLGGPLGEAHGIDHYFASGTNNPGEIRAVALSGHDIGAAVQELSEASLHEMEQFAHGGTKFFVDSGAFSEVSFPEGGPPSLTSRVQRSRISSKYNLVVTVRILMRPGFSGIHFPNLQMPG